MEISPISKKYANSFKKKPFKKQQKYNAALKKFYNEINESYNEINKLGSIDFNNRLVLQNVVTEKSVWIPDDISKHIDYNMYYVLKYNKKINNLYKINIILYIEKENMQEINTFKNYIKLILIWYNFIVKYSNQKCYKNINITLYLTDFLKILPSSPVYIIGPNNVNTGYTARCIKNNNITIYRKEEWFKVLIHESMHYLALDFSIANHDLHSTFPLEQSDMSLSECYVEAWARILNTYFVSYYLLLENKSFVNFEKISNILLGIESSYSSFQANKVLSFLGLTYLDLIGKDEISRSKRNLYKEDSNVFSYYILCNILMDDPISFVVWCATHNTNTIKINHENIKTLEKYIKDNHNNISLLENNKISTDKLVASDNNFLNNTLRMTIIEIV